MKSNQFKDKFVLVVLIGQFVIATFVYGAVPTVEEYMRHRMEVEEADTATLLGGNMTLTDPREIQVNKILMSFKEKEYREGVDSNGRFFAAAQHFFHSKKLIEASEVFKIIKMLPKGAGLHTHEANTGHSKYAAFNLTKMDNLYYCVNDMENNHLLFHFFESAPSHGCSPTAQWKTVKDLKNTASSQDWIDNWFLSSMSMFTPTPEVDYPDTDRAWIAFERKIGTVFGIINYSEALKKYYYQLLQGFYDDNVRYIELRGLLINGYHLNQTELTPLEMLTVYKETTDRFVQDHPDFWGARFIYSPHRYHTPDSMKEFVKEATIMAKVYPDFFAGFDLVGQEDKGFSLLGFLPELLNATAQGIKFFFHAGETNWFGTAIDENMLDAALLNTTRFGHGYALSKHPVLYEMAIKKGIAVEVCPISNQVLSLLDDFRNHPATNYFRNGFPVVVASDAPGIWGAAPLSHDWYIAFMAISGHHTDLRFLKQLAINSIKFSAMKPMEKDRAMEKWNKQWNVFLTKVIHLYGTPANKTEIMNQEHDLHDDIVPNTASSFCSDTLNGKEKTMECFPYQSNTPVWHSSK